MTDETKLMQYDANKKSMLVAYLLTWLLGGLGVHRFYLNRKKSGLVMLLITVVSIPIVFTGIFVPLFSSQGIAVEKLVSLMILGFVLIMFIAVWVIVDLFLVHKWVRTYNNNLIEGLNSKEQSAN